MGIPEKIGREQGTEKGQAVYDRAKETVGGLLKQSYEYDLYDTILEYLISEGYADTEDSALAIMANMSEEWRDDIIEYSFPLKKSELATVEKIRKRLDDDERPGSKKNSNPELPIERTSRKRNPNLRKVDYR